MLDSMKVTQRVAGVVALGVVATTAGSTLATVGAQSMTVASCPAAFPTQDLVGGGQEVHGLTVTRGTTPDSFTGTVIGVLEDAIAPGLDMIMAELSSAEVDRVGIWQGMSGSPVYAADGRLVGAVAYGLAAGASPVAGITPAAEMHALLDTQPAAPAPKLADEEIQLSTSERQQLVESGAASSAEAQAGFERLPIPLGVYGMVNQTRLRHAAKRFGFDGAQVYRASATSMAAATTEIVPGGNLAASLSYGDVSAAGVGTATAVCGDEVLAFGHPAFFTGPSTMTMHGADALYIQADPLGPGFKVANISGPNGTVTDDRLPGLRGLVGSPPRATHVASQVTKLSGASRAGSTWISVPDWVPDLAATHLLSNHDRVFDGIGKGSAEAAWTVRGLRQSGTAFAFSRTDHFSSLGDIGFVPAGHLYDQLAQIVYNDFEDVTITSVDVRSVIGEKFLQWAIGKVEVRRAGVWVRAGRLAPIRTRPGKTIRLRVTLRSYRNLEGTTSKRIDIAVPNVRVSYAALAIAGGQDSFGDESAAGSFAGVLRQVATAPRNDQVLADLHIRRRNGGFVTRSSSATANATVTGWKEIPVVVR